MIVRPGDGVLHLVTQPDHAALAARLMAEWPPLAGASRRADILTAIEHHDRGWGESDAAPTVDPATGRIRDFIGAPIAIRQGVWPVSVRLLAGTPWAAALVAHHAVTVYGRFRADEAWQAFFPAMTALRDEYLARAGGELAVLEADYVHVRLGDLLSLVFCTGASQPEYFGPWTIRLHGCACRSSRVRCAWTCRSPSPPVRLPTWRTRTTSHFRPRSPPAPGACCAAS